MSFFPGFPDNSSGQESEITLGSHTGTHVDPPQHVSEDGGTVQELDLEDFYGECQLLDLKHCREKVDRSDLKEKDIESEIVLLKTDNSSRQYEDFREDFTYLTLEGVKYLIEENVKTVGIDYLSLVKFDGGEKAHRAHRKANENMNVVEGLDLRNAEPGKYLFTGMPLRMETDGSPLRAALIDR